MPRVPSYQRQSVSTQMPNVRVQGVGDAAAYGAGTAQALGGIGQGIMQAGEEVSRQQIELQQNINTQKVLDLSTQANEDFANNFHNGYLTLKGRDTFGITKDAGNELNNMLKKYTDQAENDVQKLAITQYLMPRIDQYRKLVMGHERQQIDEATEQSVADQMASSERMAIASRNNPDAFMMHINSGLQSQELGLRRKGLTAESISEKKITYTSGIVKNAILTDIAEGNLDGAQSKLKTYTDKLDPRDKAELDNKIRPIAENNEIVMDVEALKKDPANYTNGVFDAVKAKAAMEAKYGPNATKTISVPGKGGLSWEQTANIVAGGESSGWDNPYDAVNPDSGAFGKYQFMPDTWKGLMGDAPHTPENQEIAFAKMHKETYDKYGTAGVLVANYAGTQNAARYMNGQDLIGDNGKPYSADAPQYYNGREYPSVRQYVINALGNDGLHGVSTTQTVSAFDARKYERVMNLIDAAASDSNREKSIRDKNELDRVLNARATATSDFDKINIIQNSSLEPYIKETLIKQVNSQKVSDISALAALEKLAAHGNLTEQDVLGQARLLDQESILKYLGKAYAIGANQQDKESADSDKQWHAYIDEKGPYAGANNKKQNDELLVSISGRLNREGLKGYARYDRALELMKEEEKNKGSIIYQVLKNNQSMQTLRQAYPDIFDLGVEGLKSTGKWSGDEWTLNQMLTDITSQSRIDPAADQALINMKKFRIPITYESFQKAYEREAYGG